jgi:Mrp family chromosome partitioning ATPase
MVVLALPMAAVLLPMSAKADSAPEPDIVTKYQPITRVSNETGSKRILHGLGLVLTAGMTWLFVRSVRNETLAARKAEVEGWALPNHDESDNDLEDEPRVQEVRARYPSVVPEAERERPFSPAARAITGNEGDAEPTGPSNIGTQSPELAGASGPRASLTPSRTRLIYQVGQYHFAADPQVLSPATHNHLQDLCDVLCAPGNTRRVLRVASGLSCRYAKTQVSAQLAQMLAERNMRVLALEGDLDAPALHKVLRVNIPRNHGLTEQLQRMADASQVDAISMLQLSEDLHALVESRWSTPAALGLPHFAELLMQQRDVYDFIVVDGPVVDSWPDADHFGRQVDGVVFVTLTGARLPDTLTLLGKHFSHDLLLRIIKASDHSAS